MSYNVSEYTMEAFPSDSRKYKLDVYQDGVYLTSIGAKGYSDYRTYIQTHGQEYADRRRILYYNRHKKDIEQGGRGYLAWLFLWN